ncbi:MAG: alkaline phosphatase family protein [Armatimonadota bacterium]
MGTTRPELLIIGLDGACFDLVGPWLDGGLLPNLRTLMDEGAFGSLRSTVPAITPTAWTTMATGVNPGRHGVFNFVQLADGCGYDGEITSRATCAVDSVWRMLNEGGATCGLFAVPWTHPPEALDRFVLAGYGAPNSDPSVAHPEELFDEVVGRFGAYPLWTDWLRRPGSREARADLSAADIETHVEQLAAISSYLLEHHPTDVFMMVFNCTDWIAHFFMQHRQVRGADDVVRHTYRKVDDAIGCLVRQVGEQANVLVVSDHGIEASSRSVNLAQWLYEEGLWSPTSEPAADGTPVSRLSPTQRATAAAGRAASLARWSIPTPVAGLLARPYRYLRDKWSWSAVESPVNWARTKAFLWGSRFPFIQMNVRGREPVGTVSPGSEYEQLRQYLVDELLQLRDEETGQRILRSVYQGEELYHGPRRPHWPDIVPVFAPHYGHVWSLNAPGPVGSAIAADLDLRDGRDADHSQHGLFIARGPAVGSRGPTHGLRLEDIAPSILAMVGLPVPSGLDGGPAPCLSQPDGTTPVRRRELSPATHPLDGGAHTPEEQAIIRARLHDLGYL